MPKRRRKGNRRRVKCEWVKHRYELLPGTLPHWFTLHSIEPLGNYTHTGLDNFTASHTHISFFNFPTVPCSQPYCSTWHSSTVETCSLLWDEGARGECSKPRRDSTSNAYNYNVFNHAGHELHAAGKERFTENIGKQKGERNAPTCEFTRCVYLKINFIASSRLAGYKTVITRLEGHKPSKKNNHKTNARGDGATGRR